MLTSSLLLLTLVAFAHSQINDHAFLNQVRGDINFEINTARGEFLYTAQLAQEAAKKYIALKVKENLFRELVQLEDVQAKKALGLAEDEQVEEEEVAEDKGRSGIVLHDDEDEEEEESKEEKGGTAAPTTKPVILQTADLLKVIFGPSGGVNGLVSGIAGKGREDLNVKPIENLEVEKVVEELAYKSSLRIDGPNANIAKNPLVTNPEQMYNALGSSFLKRMGYGVLSGKMSSDKNLFYGARDAFLVNVVLRDFLLSNALA